MMPRTPDIPIFNDSGLSISLIPSKSSTPGESHRIFKELRSTLGSFGFDN